METEKNKQPLDYESPNRRPPNFSKAYAYLMFILFAVIAGVCGAIASDSNHDERATALAVGIPSALAALVVPRIMLKDSKD